MSVVNCTDRTIGIRATGRHINKFVNNIFLNSKTTAACPRAFIIILFVPARARRFNNKFSNASGDFALIDHCFFHKIRGNSINAYTYREQLNYLTLNFMLCELYCSVKFKVTSKIDKSKSDKKKWIPIISKSTVGNRHQS